jgi:hypothetical protein
MKTIRPPLKNLHNEEWLGFFTDFKKPALHFGAESIGLNALFGRFLPL